MTNVRRIRATLLLLFSALLAAPGFSQEAPSEPVDEAPVYFSGWEWTWGADATFTASDLEKPSTTQVNDGSSEFDELRLRLDAALAYQDQGQLVIDLFTSNAANPAIYGLYAKLTPTPWITIQVGRMPLTFGAWQERATAYKNPLVGAPLLAQSLVSLRSGAVPASIDELLTQRGRGRDASFSIGGSGGHSLAITYEHCWDTGVEFSGRLGSFEWRLAGMTGTPGSAEVHDNNDGKSIEARVAWRFGDAIRVGASGSRGSYLTDELEGAIGVDPDDFDHQLLGADAEAALGPVTLRAEWIRSDYESPFIDQDLELDTALGEIEWAILPWLSAAGRFSALRFSDATASSGETLPWEADADRLEAGLRARFWDDQVSVKAVYQKTTLDLASDRDEEIWALQLGIHH